MTQNLEMQTRNALSFVQKLYFEISYLIKEVEGLLHLEEEEFVIGRPSGYAVTSGKSTGLEPANVESWLSKAFTVFFVSDKETKLQSGMTITPFHNQLRLLLLDIELEGKKNKTPRIMAGVLYDIRSKRDNYTKFEHMMSEFIYSRDRVFASVPELSYEDSYLSMKGNLFNLPLFSVQTSEDISQKIVEPMLAQYRKIL
jgi:hypothetical protein